ncbi:hypothetical protein LZC04_09300, partial [Campylobacter coli]
EDLTIKKKARKKKKKNAKGKKKKKNDFKNIKKLSVSFSDVMGRVGSLPRWFPLFNFFCLLVFRLTSSVALWGGGMLQTNSTVVCTQYLSPA